MVSWEYITERTAPLSQMRRNDMNNKFEKLGFYPADILLPKEQDMTKWLSLIHI